MAVKFLQFHKIISFEKNVPLAVMYMYLSCEEELLVSSTLNC